MPEATSWAKTILEKSEQIIMKILDIDLKAFWHLICPIEKRFLNEAKNICEDEKNWEKSAVGIAVMDWSKKCEKVDEDWSNPKPLQAEI